MISRFFFPSSLPSGGEVPLPETLAHHAARVLRLQDGDPVVLFDGRGGEHDARLVVRGKHWFATLLGQRPCERESPLGLVLVQGLASGDKMDWVVQKATELGVQAVVPLAAARSVLKLSAERAGRRLAHWQQVAVASCEQCGRNRVPAVRPLATLGAYLSAAQPVRKLVLAPAGGKPLGEIAMPGAGEEVHLLIGPEGGWTDEELALCLKAGAEPLSLGPRVLRTETAGLAAVAAMQALWGDY
jgi:16S rRNA (uracil1498-N3)-methyltransferase